MKNSISATEKETLAKWVEESGPQELDEVLESSWQAFEPEEHLEADKAKEMFQSILLTAKAEETNNDHKIIQLKPARRFWRTVAIAASVIGIAGIIAYFSWNVSKVKQPSVVAVARDVKPPQINKATITLAGGKIIILDTAGNGTLAKQNNISIIKTGNGQIEYQSSGTRKGVEAVSYNTLSNPRGSKPVTLTLSDGSKVWLNTESSLTYPTRFIGTERKVKITGEAYFEVAHNADMPFKVDNGDAEVTVLGTHFNVNAYDDEDALKVTLLQGSVKVSASRMGHPAPDVTVLKPGQQAIVSLSLSKTSVNNSPDLEQVMAWKNGIFKFDGSDVESVMKQVSRWYDVEINYQGQKPVANFRGTISRQENISEVLKMLELTGAVKFRIEGNKVIVSK